MSFFGTISGLFSQPKIGGQPARRIPQPVPIKPQHNQKLRQQPQAKTSAAMQKPVMDDTMIREHKHVRARSLLKQGAKHLPFAKKRSVRLAHFAKRSVTKSVHWIRSSRLSTLAFVFGRSRQEITKKTAT